MINATANRATMPDSGHPPKKATNHFRHFTRPSALLQLPPRPPVAGRRIVSRDTPDSWSKNAGHATHVAYRLASARHL